MLPSYLSDCSATLASKRRSSFFDISTFNFNLIIICKNYTKIKTI